MVNDEILLHLKVNLFFSKCVASTYFESYIIIIIFCLYLFFLLAFML